MYSRSLEVEYNVYYLCEMLNGEEEPLPFDEWLEVRDERINGN